ncbi:precorrin-4 C(11)-methyltransferase [Hoyosella rhizosphaerae]|uniref:Precorrin-4 C(11)-methyltransferase n=1 Tax=Hoyosella rhizosphaerae TaxID=1755582 RepID=A0A916TZJ2_9ACTN|nr:precorrin-4 C(11)-methyltransferase [Hoyosella rhizosphaerae]MBN4927068.1 precorrin-4 C(11)-methyltransferase [Hoyosella rhizosphaerae]GGC54301.1 precorrin-4 C(11)-methyltransferase [Hoyosella rhizosphaerae]
MTVYFVGAGPGAADLITLRGRDVIARCSVCLYAGSLVPVELLDYCPEGAELINTARMPLAEIVKHMVDADRAGSDVARLHSGDPSLYSAVAEQVRQLGAHGVNYQIVPGVPAFAAAAAALGRELTVPGVGQSVLITRIAVQASAMPPGEELAQLAATGVTLALHLAAAHMDKVVEAIEPHYGADCPAAVVAFASRENEVILRTTVGMLRDRMAEAGVTKTAVIFVGRVLSAEGFPDSYLYSAARNRTSH